MKTREELLDELIILYELLKNGGAVNGENIVRIYNQITGDTRTFSNCSRCKKNLVDSITNLLRRENKI